MIQRLFLEMIVKIIFNKYLPLNRLSSIVPRMSRHTSSDKLTTSNNNNSNNNNNNNTNNTNK